VKGVFFMEALWTRFQPLALEVKRIAEEGTLGLPVLLHADLSLNYDIYSMLFLSFFLADKCSKKRWLPLDIPLTHRILDPALGGGALLDM
jgi:predicted dehydrogenase